MPVLHERKDDGGTGGFFGETNLFGLPCQTSLLQTSKSGQLDCLLGKGVPTHALQRQGSTHLGSITRHRHGDGAAYRPRRRQRGGQLQEESGGGRKGRRPDQVLRRRCDRLPGRRGRTRADHRHVRKDQAGIWQGRHRGRQCSSRCVEAPDGDQGLPHGQDLQADRPGLPLSHPAGGAPDGGRRPGDRRLRLGFLPSPRRARRAGRRQGGDGGDGALSGGRTRPARH